MALNTIEYQTVRRRAKEPRWGFDVAGALFLVAGVVAGYCVLSAAVVGADRWRRLAKELGARKAWAAGGLNDKAFALAVDAVVAVACTWLAVDLFRLKRWTRPVVFVVACGAAALTSGWLAVNAVLAVEGFVRYSLELSWLGDLFGVLVRVGVVGVVFPVLLARFLVAPETVSFVERAGPRLGWSERCELRVLVACAGLLLGAARVFWCLRVGDAPVFGAYWNGEAGRAVIFGTAGALGLSAALMFAGWRAGWWPAIVTVATAFASAATTYWAYGPLSFYYWLGDGAFIGPRGESYVAEMLRSAVFGGRAPVWVVATGAASVGYLFWVRGGVGRRRGFAGARG